MLNTTFFVISLSGTAIISGVFAKSFFTKLLYKSESIRNGQDILSKFGRSPNARKLVVIAMLLICVWPSYGIERGGAANGEATVSETEIRKMKDSIESALSDSEISWRMKRAPKESVDEGGPFKAVLEKMVEIAKYTGKKIEQFLEWMIGSNDQRATTPTLSKTGGGSDGFLRLLAVLGLVLVLFFVLWCIVAVSAR